MTETPQLRKCSRCKCNILLETYYSKNRKGEYKKTCNGCQNRVSCPKYDYKCASNGDLHKHIKRIHDKTKDLKCLHNDCKYVCGNISDLNIHIKQVHNKTKDFKCPTCDFTCGRLSGLNTHIKSVHNKIKDFQCEHCEYKCSENGNLKIHTKRIHTKSKDFECSIEGCDYKCSNNSDLKKHIKQVHDKIKDFNCSIEGCDFKCSTNSGIKIHIKRCTGNEQGSSGEVKIKKVLNEMKIEFQYNSTYEVKAKHLLRWDFIITDYDEPIFIEYDGKQHFEPATFGGISKERANEAFQKQKEYDKIKNDYCDENGYHLLRIPYTEYANIEAIITEFMTTNTDWGNE